MVTTYLIAMNDKEGNFAGFFSAKNLKEAKFIRSTRIGDYKAFGETFPVTGHIKGYY